MAPHAITNPVLDKLDITPHPRPFKNPHWKPAARRNKSLKQILSEHTRAQSSLLASAQSTSGATTPNPPAPAAAPLPRPSAAATAATAAAAPMAATYSNIESAPSLHPARGSRWCDITGLPAKYTDPKTKLRYADREVYAAIRALPAGSAERFLEMRGANIVLK